MRHRIKGRKLGRKAENRRALRMNLLKSLFSYGRVTTTVAKAKEYRSAAERMITLAKVKTLHNVRRAAQLLRNDKTVVRQLFDEIGPRFKDRPGGYTRILRLAKPRLGDNAPRVIWELVGESERRAREAEARKEEAAAAGKKAKEEQSAAK